jgi:hypothetical protein
MQNSHKNPYNEMGVEVIRDAGPMNAGETMVAFLKDPDGYEIEYLVFHNYNVFFENKIIFPEFMFSGPISIRY